MDLRKPSGWFFVLLGALLLVAGALGQTAPPLLTVNLNAIMGVVMALFGAALLALARRAA